MFPAINNVTVLDSCPRRGAERYYVTVVALKVDRDSHTWLSRDVHVTGTVNDGVFDTGDAMIHLPGMAFVAQSRDMQIIN